MLLPDEELVLYWLEQYGPLWLSQIQRVFADKDAKKVARMLRGLERQGLAAELIPTLYGLDVSARLDERMERAVWALLDFLPEIGPYNHCAAAYPAQIYFLKQEQEYVIIALGEREEHLLRLLDRQEGGEVKFIVLLPPHAAFLPRVSRPCLFASVENQAVLYLQED